MQKTKREKSNKSLLGKAFRLILPHLLPLSLGIVFTGVSVFLMLYIPILLGRGIDQIIGPADVNFDIILKLLTKSGILGLVYGVLQWLTGIINNRVSFKIIKNIRIAAFNKLVSLPLNHIDQNPHGDIINRIISDADQFADGLLLGFTQLFSGIISILASIFFMVSINWQVALFVILLTPLSLFVARYIAKNTFGLFLDQSKVRGEQGALINEMVSNLKVVQAYSQEETAIEKFKETNERLEKISIRAIFISSLTRPAARFVNSLIYSAVALIGAFISLANGNLLSVGQFIVLLTYANQYANPFNDISEVFAEMQNALASAGRIFDFIELEAEKPDKKDAKILSNVKGRLSLKNVYFSYKGHKELIKDFNLSVKPGQRVAIVGPSGSGKTTLINLLMRFYDIDSGQILLDDKDIFKATRHSLRSAYGMVLQETWLRSTSVKENIALGKPDATDEEIIEAAKKCHAHNFIMALEKGYDTVLTADGGSLSQGQKQLLSITRIILNPPPMLILDEATSSIDTRTELIIQDAFAKLMEGRTSFIVAHRLSTIKEADIILVMDKGQIIEQGKHDKLLEKDGFYANLYKSQFAF